MRAPLKDNIITEHLTGIACTDFSYAKEAPRSSIFLEQLSTNKLVRRGMLASLALKTT